MLGLWGLITDEESVGRSAEAALLLEELMKRVVTRLALAMHPLAGRVR